MVQIEKERKNFVEIWQSSLSHSALRICTSNWKFSDSSRLDLERIMNLFTMISHLFDVTEWYSKVSKWILRLINLEMIILKHPNWDYFCWYLCMYAVIYNTLPSFFAGYCVWEKPHEKLRKSWIILCYVTYQICYLYLIVGLGVFLIKGTFVIQISFFCNSFNFWVICFH